MAQPPAGSSLLFGALADSGRIKQRENGSYRMVLEGVDEIDWFTNRPFRSEGLWKPQELIRKWDSLFETSEPNAQASFKVGEERELMTFELFKPKFNNKKQRLSFKIDAGIINDRESDLVTGLKGKTLDEVTLFIDDATLEANSPSLWVEEAVKAMLGTPRSAENWDLSGTDLTDANLTNANLTNANLMEANLTGANLTDAELRNANLADANLTDADLGSAKLYDANLTGANLTRANLSGAYLSGANLAYADLDEADLNGAKLRGANLTSADLTDADLTGPDLTNADLTGAYLSGADLTGTNLTDAELRNANLTSANLTEANLISADLTNATYDPKTTWPTAEFWKNTTCPDGTNSDEARNSTCGFKV